MKHYAELIKARLENIAGAVASVARGLIYFRTDTNRPVIDDGTDVTQLMMEKHLPEARRDTKVQLDDTGTGSEVEGVLPPERGGTGPLTLTGEQGKFIRVNAAGTGYELAEGGKEVIVDTKANIDALPRVEGLLYYATDEDVLYTDDGTNVNPIEVDLGEGYWFRQTTAPVTADGVIAELGVSGLTIGNRYKVTVVARCRRQTTEQNEIQTITFDNTPDEGDFTLTFDGQTTLPLGWDASATEVEDALLALSNIDASGVVVSGSMSTGFTIEFVNTEGNQDQPQIAVTNSSLKFGGVGGQNEVQDIVFNDVPTGGTFTITFDGQTTAAIPYNATPAQVEAALELLPNINGVTVTDI